MARFLASPEPAAAGRSRSRWCGAAASPHCTTKEDKYRSAEGKKSRPAARPRGDRVTPVNKSTHLPLSAFPPFTCSPLASRLSPLAPRPSPLASRLLPLAPRLSPLASCLSPLAPRLSPLASRLNNHRATLSAPACDVQEWCAPATTPPAPTRDRSATTAAPALRVQQCAVQP